LEVEGLSVRHPDGALAIDRVSFTLERGSFTVITGPVGAGKSTLFDLLLRFNDPDSGSIALGGIDLRQLPLTELRRHITLVPQQPALFTGSVRYNIAYGRPGAGRGGV
jgi:ATP-binding cassette subfamily B protein